MKSIRKLNHSLWLVFVGCSLSYLLIQLETLYFIFSQEIKGGRNIIEELGIVFFSQGQNLLLAGILALGFYFLRHNKITRGLYVLILAVMLFYLTVNQLFYERFFDHIQFGLVEGEANLSLLWGSFLAELDRVFFINLSLVGCSVFVFAYQLIPNQKPIESAETKHQNKIAIGLLFCWTLVSLWFNTRYNDERNWVNHPFITLTTSLFPNQEEIHIRKKELVNTDIYSLRYGTAPRDITFEGKIPANYPNGYREKPPNVIYIILESVGAKNIFPNPSFNELDSLLTPNLYKWRSQLISFPTIYNIFPGTTSSHFTIHTGGCADVIRNINRLSEIPYMGFTLPELFKKMNYETALFSSLFLYRTKYWYAQMPFDKKFIPDELPKKDLDRNKLTSWGIREEVSIEKSLDWLS
ncbi:MAG: sulfatase-like hydrolase/transferase, partial [Chitinophagales bacterium]